MLSARRANQSNFASARGIDVTHQTTVLFGLKIPEGVATAEPQLSIAFGELYIRTVAVDQQDFPGAKLRPAVLRRTIKEVYSVSSLPMQLIAVCTAVNYA